MKIGRFWWLGLVAFAAISCVTSRQEVVTIHRYEFQQPEMGVSFRIILYAPSPNAAQGAAAAAFQRIHQINTVTTDDGSDSELSRLALSAGQNREVNVSPDLWVVLEQAAQLTRSSHGAFDVTVGPLAALWRFSSLQGAPPDPNRLARARLAVGYTKMQLNSARHTVKLLASDMRLDLGGIAKGYAVAQAMVTLSRLGVGSALVSGGGDMAVSGPPPGKPGWRIQLPPSDAAQTPPAQFIVLTNAGISTSGGFDSRLIDPRTGIVLTNQLLVTVIAPDDFTAGGLAKVAAALPPKEALKFIRKIPGATVRIVRKTGDKMEAYESSGFGRFYE